MNTLKGVLFLFIVIAMSCNSNKKVVEEVPEEGIVKALNGKVLVTLLEGQKTETLEADFTKYSLKHKSIASRSLNQHLFTFDKNKISSEDIIKKLNKNKKVYLAEPLKYGIGKPQKLGSGKKGKAVVK